MAMRLYSRADFEDELIKHGLSKTDFKTAEFTLWMNDKGATFFLPTLGDSIPDYVLDRILEKLGKLYQFSEPNIQKSYTVHEEAAKPESAEILPIRKPDDK